MSTLAKQLKDLMEPRYVEVSFYGYSVTITYDREDNFTLYYKGKEFASIMNGDEWRAVNFDTSIIPAPAIDSIIAKVLEALV